MDLSIIEFHIISQRLTVWDSLGLHTAFVAIQSPLDVSGTAPGHSSKCWLDWC